MCVRVHVHVLAPLCICVMCMCLMLHIPGVLETTRDLYPRQHRHDVCHRTTPVYRKDGMHRCRGTWSDHVWSNGGGLERVSDAVLSFVHVLDMCVMWMCGD